MTSDNTNSVGRDRRRSGEPLTNSRWQPSGDAPPFPPPPPIAESSVPELFFQQARQRQKACFARFRDVTDNQWVVYSWAEAAAQVASLSTFLIQKGVKPGDRVAILSGTRYEWVLADLAILSVGAISVPIYHSLTAAEVAFLLLDSGACGVFVENRSQFEKILSALRSPVKVETCDDFEGGEFALTPPFVVTIEEIDRDTLDRSASMLKGNVPSNFWNITPRVPAATVNGSPAVKRDRTDIASIVYTSGTTGVPKGVVQSHGNHLAMLDGVLLSGLMGTGERVFLFLPLAHSFARLIAYAVIASGGDLILPTVIDKNETKFDAKRILSDAAAGEPMIFPSVPRIFEKLMEALQPERPKGLKQRLVSWAIAKLQKDNTHKFAQKIAKSAREKIFGKRFLYGVSGGAPISVEVLRFFDLIGAPIFEGYGLTETTPAIAANTSRFRKIGSVGRPFAGCEIRIDHSDGEILASGGNIALGYWKRPKSTDASWENGWFRTGDVGEIDEEGFLYITDRKKDLIVTAGGKKIPPSLLEGKLKLSPYISQCLVFGERKPYLSALITINEAAVREAITDTDGTSASLPELAKLSAAVRLIEGEVKRVNAELATFEQIKRFAILPEDFTVENGLLSPTLKLKRKEICKRFSTEIEELYRTPFAGKE